MGTFPDEVIAFLNRPNPSRCTMFLGFTQSLAEMSTRNIPGSKGAVTAEDYQPQRHL
jgi:hypothetical protein